MTETLRSSLVISLGTIENCLGFSLTRKPETTQEFLHFSVVHSCVPITTLRKDYFNYCSHTNFPCLEYTDALL